MKIKLKGGETVIDTIPAPSDAPEQEGPGIWITDQDQQPVFIPEGEYEEYVESDQAEVPTLTAYDVKTKTKNVPMLNAVITKTARGAYMAQGVSATGNKLTTLMREEKALALVKAGVATQGW